MATLAPNAPSPGTELALGRLHAAIDADLAGETLYASGTEFLAADLPGAGELLMMAVREGRSVALVFPDGEERFIVSTSGPGVTGIIDVVARSVRSLVRRFASLPSH